MERSCGWCLTRSSADRWVSWPDSPGCLSPPSAREYPRPAEPVMVFCGFSRERLDTVLDAFKACGAPAALKAVLTATNQSWSLSRLADELQAERAEIARSLQGGK